MNQKKVDFEVLSFNPVHLDLLEMREEEAFGIMTLDNAMERFKRIDEISLEAKTFIHDGRILFCAGYYELWPGVIECWMMPSIYVQDMVLSFSKILRSYVHAIIAKEDCHRFQTSAPEDALHARWMEFLGLKKEGVMRKFTHNGKDYGMYSWVRDE